MFNLGWLSLLIMDELKKIEPSLQLKSADNNLLRICTNDFTNCITYIHNNSQELAMPNKVEVELNLQTGVFRVTENDEAKEISDFIKVWIKWWWTKYKERVTLTLFKNDKAKDSKLVAKGRLMLGQFTEKERNDIQEAVVMVLMDEKEYCFSEPLANALFKRVLGRYSTKTKWDKEKKIRFMIALTKETRRLCATKGILIFLRPDKRYYYLREFRDEGERNHIT